MQKEFTFVMIKPHALKYSGRILSELDNYGKRLNYAKVEEVSPRIIQAHYAPHKNKPFFIPMITEFIGMPVNIALYEGERGIVKKFKEVIGATDPFDASEDTIRGKYRPQIENDGWSIIVPLWDDYQIIRNIVHTSESFEEAQRELRVWREFFHINNLLEQYIERRKDKNR